MRRVPGLIAHLELAPCLVTQRGMDRCPLETASHVWGLHLICYAPDLRPGCSEHLLNVASPPTLNAFNSIPGYSWLSAVHAQRFLLFKPLARLH